MDNNLGQLHDPGAAINETGSRPQWVAPGYFSLWRLDYFLQLDFWANTLGGILTLCNGVFVFALVNFTLRFCHSYILTHLLQALR